MNKIYDKLLLVIALLILAGGVFLYLQKSGDATSLNAPINVQTADKPYLPETVSSQTLGDVNWPEAPEQSTGWRYDVFTPPKIFIDENGQFSEEGWEPPVPPPPFGIYLAQIERKLYRIQIGGYSLSNEDSTDASKALLFMYDEEAQKQVLARVGEEKNEAGFELLSFDIERLYNEDGTIQTIAKATILDLRSGKEVLLTDAEPRYDSDLTAVIRSDEDASFNIELTDAPHEFEGPMGRYTLLEISLEASSVKVIKDANGNSEAETRVLKALGVTTSSTPEIITPETNALQGAEKIFDSMF